MTKAEKAINEAEALVDLLNEKRNAAAIRRRTEAEDQDGALLKARHLLEAARACPEAVSVGYAAIELGGVFGGPDTYYEWQAKVAQRVAEADPATKEVTGDDE